MITQPNNLAQFKFFPKPFDTQKPPPPPPNREFWVLPLFGRRETKESQRQGLEYQFRLDEYDFNLRRGT